MHLTEEPKNVGTDYSDFDEFVVELDNPNQVNVNVRVENGAQKACEAHGTGNTIIVTLDKAIAQEVHQAYLQCYSAVTDPVSVTFKKAYFKANVAGETVVLFDGEQPFTNWSTSKTIDKAFFANAKAGDKIVVTGKIGSFDAGQGWQESYGGQIYLKTRRNGWADLTQSLKMTDAYADYIFTITDDEITIEEEQKDKTKVPVKTTPLKELQNYGLAIQGMGSIMTKVVLISSGTSSNIANTIAAPVANSSKIYNLAGQQVNASYKGVVIKNGKKYVQ